MNAPDGQRATWFALMASLMNLALGGRLVGEQVSQSDLRASIEGPYGQLPALVLCVTAIVHDRALLAILAIAPRLQAKEVEFR